MNGTNMKYPIGELAESASAAVLTADDQRSEKKQERNRSIIKLCAIGTLILIVIIFSSIAWFTMNRETSTSGMNIKAGGPSFELAVAGDNIGAISYMGSGENSATYTGTALNDFQTGPNAADGQNGTYNISTGGSGTFYTTGGSDDVIKWRLESEYDRYDDGLGPDSQGSFTFYVVPKVSGSLTVKFSLALEGYAATVTKNDDLSFNVDNLAKIEESNAEYSAVTYLNGHMLFFTGRNGSGTEQSPYYYTGLIDKDEFEMTFNNCTVDEVIPVTLYWIWPKTFVQLICLADSGNVAATSDTTTAADLRQYVVDNSTMILKDITAAKAKEYMTTSETVGEETVYTFDSDTTSGNLTVLSTGYNKADQNIGTTVKYFLLVLSAD